MAKIAPLGLCSHTYLRRLPLDWALVFSVSRIIRDHWGDSSLSLVQEARYQSTYRQPSVQLLREEGLGMASQVMRKCTVIHMPTLPIAGRYGLRSVSDRTYGGNFRHLMSRFDRSMLVR